MTEELGYTDGALDGMAGCSDGATGCTAAKEDLVAAEMELGTSPSLSVASLGVLVLRPGVILRLRCFSDAENEILALCNHLNGNPHLTGATFHRTALMLS